MYNQVVLLASIEQSIPTDRRKNAARKNAKSFFREHLQFSSYDYIGELHNDEEKMSVTPFNTVDGTELVTERLQQTRKNRREKLEKLRKQVDGEKIEDLISSGDLASLSYFLQRGSSRANVLYDGTSYHRGRMIASEEKLEKVTALAEKENMDLVAVEMSCSY